MAKIEQYSRIINHAISTSGLAFTVPSSNDHTDETWLATDLYIAEFGVNVTDDTVYVRTNNGIVKLATATSSTGAAQVWSYNSPNIVIGSTYSAAAITRNSSSYTDLGSSSLRFKDVYLGDSASGNSTINVNAGLWLKEATDSILVTNNVSATNAPIEIDGSSNTNKDRVLNLNSRYVTNSGSTNYNVSIASQTVSMTNNSKAVVIAGSDVTLTDGISNIVHLGKGYSKADLEDDQVVIGGSSAVRGTSDDGSNLYNNSDWITKQARITTTDATTVDLVSIPWYSTSLYGELIQVKTHIIATSIDDASIAYSSEITGVYSVNESGLLTEVGLPVLNQWIVPGLSCLTEMASDASGVYVKVKGDASYTMKWLATYSYHRLINILP